MFIAFGEINFDLENNGYLDENHIVESDIFLQRKLSFIVILKIPSTTPSLDYILLVVPATLR